VLQKIDDFDASSQASKHGEKWRQKGDFMGYMSFAIAS